MHNGNLLTISDKSLLFTDRISFILHSLYLNHSPNPPPTLPPHDSLIFSYYSK